MKVSLGEKIKRLRMKHNLSQQQFAELMFVDRSSVANWETDRRVPNLEILSHIADFFNVSVSEFISYNKTNTNNINIIMVDDEEIILNGNIDILKDFFPNAVLNGFTSSQKALKFAENNKVDLAFLDIEMSGTNGIELCKKLLGLNPRTNVIYLTGYSDYAIDAWTTGASGFLLKPLNYEQINQAIGMLRYPIGGAI